MDIFADMTVIPTGIRHGTVTVAAPEGKVEITTFRSETGYSDGRHPDEVDFVTSIEEDLARRDFTVNAMAYAPATGLVDPYGGREDLAAGVLRTVGDPGARFREDGLRILRALRFMSQKGYEPDAAIDAALHEHYQVLGNVSVERIDEELVKFLCGQGAPALLDRYSEIFCYIIPELEPMIGYEQHSPYHNRDVWHHTLAAVADVPPSPEFRVAMLFHDIAKPVVGVLDDNGRGRFVGHPAKGAEMAGTILTRMKFSGDFIKKVVTLIRYHDAKIAPDRVAVRKWLALLGEEMFYDLFYVRHADATGKYEKYIAEAEEKNAALRAVADAVIADGDCISLAELEVTGSDLIAAGVEKGPRVGATLSWLLDEVMEERVYNERNALIEHVKKNWKHVMSADIFASNAGCAGKKCQRTGR
jgi:tRNA nucleotidyltransferase (CCA-adding enzyme)